MSLLKTEEKIPDKWERIRFKKFVKRKKGKFEPSKENKVCKCIELEHIDQDSGFLIGNTDSNLQLSTKNVFSKGDILFGKLRPYLRKYWIASFDGVCSSEIWVLNGIPETCDNNFLFYLVQTHDFQKITNVSTGTKMPRADWDYVSKQYFRLPPLPEQHKIATILSTVDEAIRTMLQLIDAKQTFKRGVKQRLFSQGIGHTEYKDTKYGKIPKSWKLSKLEKLCNSMIAGPFGSSVKKESYTEKGYKIYGQEQVLRGNPYFGDYYISKEHFEEMKRYEVKPKDFLISLVGTIGKTLVLPKDIKPGIINPRLLRIRVNQNILDPNFLSYFLTTRIPKKYFSSYSHGLTLPILNLGIIKKTPILLMELDEQKEIVKLLHLLDNEIDLTKKSIEKYKGLKKGLMQQLLTGKIRVKVN